MTRLTLANGSSKANIAGDAAGREFSPLNNQGQVAYSFVLADGRTGVAIWSVPEIRVTDIAVVSNDVRIAWNAPAGTTNLVEASPNVSGGFTNISGNIVIVGSGPVTTNFVEVGGARKGPARYYRIRK